jgi:amidophosphoribosyltransferase
MAGIFGVVSKENCVEDAFYGTFYLQHRAQDFCGMSFYDNEKLKNVALKGLIKQQFSKNFRKNFLAYSAIGVVSSDRQPVSGLSKSGGILICFDGNLINYEQLKNKLLEKEISFDGYSNPEEITDSVIISKIISSEKNFEKGIERLVNDIEGDFSIIALTKEGIYAARGFGRKPLILGRKNESYSVSSESNSFVNTGFEIVRDVEPGEIVLLNKEGIHAVKKLNLNQIKYGTFEWVYTAHPASVIDGKSVVVVRKNLGRALAKRYPIEADIVSGIPNSGRWHGIGYSEESGIRYEEVFVRFDYSDRSFTPKEKESRTEEGDRKLIVLEEIVKGKRIIIVDDSIVRGTQTENQTRKLKEKGAKEVHARIACPPLMAACKYGKTTRKDEECIARKMSIDEIRKTRGLDSLGYATVEDLEEAIGFPREKLCLECWGIK